MIPGNDDAIRSCSLVVKAVADGIEAGKQKVSASDLTAPRPGRDSAPADAGGDVEAAAEPEPVAGEADQRPTAEPELEEPKPRSRPRRRNDRDLGHDGQAAPRCDERGDDGLQASPPGDRRRPRRSGDCCGRKALPRRRSGPAARRRRGSFSRGSRATRRQSSLSAARPSRCRRTRIFARLPTRCWPQSLQTEMMRQQHSTSVDRVDGAPRREHPGCRRAAHGCRGRGDLRRICPPTGEQDRRAPPGEGRITRARPPARDAHLVCAADLPVEGRGAGRARRGRA